MDRPFEPDPTAQLREHTLAHRDPDTFTDLFVGF
jgi:hypothetical protein